MRLGWVGLVVKQPENPEAVTAIDDGSRWQSAAFAKTMYFALDLSEGKPVFVEVHVTIAATKKTQGLIAMAGEADGLVFTTRCAMGRVDRHQGVSLADRGTAGSRLQRICANRKAEVEVVAFLRSEGDVSVMAMKYRDQEKIWAGGLLMPADVCRGDRAGG
jgi:hypothetical protein